MEITTAEQKMDHLGDIYSEDTKKELTAQIMKERKEERDKLVQATLHKNNPESDSFFAVYEKAAELANPEQVQKVYNHKIIIIYNDKFSIEVNIETIDNQDVVLDKLLVVLKNPDFNHITINNTILMHKTNIRSIQVFNNENTLFQQS